MDFNHPGPLLAHLSKVPDGQDTTTYDGSGEWVKIYTLGVELVTDPTTHATSALWLPWNNQQIPSRVSSYNSINTYNKLSADQCVVCI
jgi:hypothetical protein